MMQRFWSYLAVQLGKHAIWVTVIGLLVTIGLGLGITQLKFATGQDSYLNRDSQVYKDNVVYQRLFGGQAMLTVIRMDPGHTVDELFTGDGAQQMQDFHDTLKRSGKVESVVSPLTILRFSDSLVSSPDGNPADSVAAKALLAAQAKEQPGSEAAAARTGDAVKTLQRLSAVPEAERTFDNPEWVKFLLYNNQGEVRKAVRSVFLDSRTAQIVTRLPGNASIEEEGKASDFVRKEAAKLHLANTHMVTTGASVLLQDINNYLRGGMLTLGAIAVAIMIVILLVLFHVRWRLLPLIVVLVGVIWAFGLAGFLGIPLTIVTIAGLPVMIGIGIDYAIQMHARVEEEVVIDRAEHPIQETARNLGPALLVVTFDAVFAFLALQFAKVPMLRDFGLLLAVGIATICIGSIILPLAILGIREFRSPTKSRDFRAGPLGRLVVWLGSIPARAAVLFAALSIGIFVAGISVENQLTLQTDPVQWVNQNSQTIKDIHEVERLAGGSSELGVYATSNDVFSDKFATFAHDFTQKTLQQYPKKLLTGSSIETAIGDIVNDVPGGSDIAPRGEDVKNTYDVAPADVKESTVSDGGRAFNILFRTGPGSLEARAPVVRGIRDATHPPEGIRATPSGLAVVGVGLLDNLQANRIELTYLAILFVFLFLAFRLRSVIRSLLSLVPVLIAVGISSLVAWAFNIQLSPMTAVGGPLVIAACTEFTSLILLRYVEERRRGYEPREAIDVAASRTGRAFVVSALTAIAGVAVLSFSSLPLLRDFGRIVALNVTVALLSALVFLPPLLVWADKRNWVSRGLIDKKPQPYIETPPMGGGGDLREHVDT
ncbi:MAG TPA: MMPL family transporter [Acidimicrobiia bacterium]|jgi:hydrophobe/amphiphile efflux-3 (HAE3) family protein|nr:MMPL family transporter [Acidimicrobiia bacterium]